MKILIATCAYKRPEIFKIFLNNLPELPLLVIGSDEESYEEWVAHDRKAETFWATYDNEPLGAKFNHMLEVSEKIKYDYLFITGSDDVFCPALFDRYKTLIAEGYDYIGLQDIYFLNYFTGEIRYNAGFQYDQKGNPHGAGRCISKKILKQLDFKLWDDNINYGLDASMTKRLEGVQMKRALVNLKAETLFACDIKGNMNIHSMHEYSTYLSTVNPLNFGIKIYDTDNNVQQADVTLKPT